MLKYNLVNTSKFEIKEDILNKISETAFKVVPEFQNWVLNIVFVDDSQIQELNKTYRWKDKVTDVLSFHYFDDFQNLWVDETAWEIVLSENKIMEQAKEYGLWEEKEFYKLVIHSTLHILWYDHETDEDYEVMKPLEDKIAKEVFGEIL